MLKARKYGSSYYGSVVRNLASTHEDARSIPGFAQWSCGVGHRHGSDLAWLWLWRRPAAAALIGPLAWEFPCCRCGPEKKIPAPIELAFKCKETDKYEKYTEY